MNDVPQEVLDAIPKGLSMRLDKDVWELLGVFCISDGMRPNQFRYAAEKLIRRAAHQAIKDNNSQAVSGEFGQFESPRSAPSTPEVRDVFHGLMP